MKTALHNCTCYYTVAAVYLGLEGKAAFEFWTQCVPTVLLKGYCLGSQNGPGWKVPHTLKAEEMKSKTKAIYDWSDFNFFFPPINSLSIAIS